MLVVPLMVWSSADVAVPLVIPMEVLTEKEERKRPARGGKVEGSSGDKEEEANGGKKGDKRY